MGWQRRWDGVGLLHGKAGPPDSRGDTAPQLWGHLSQSREHSHGTDRQTCLLPPAFNCGSWAGRVLGGPEAASSMGEAGGDRAIPVRGCTSRGRRRRGTPPGHPSASWWSLGRQRHRTEQGTAEPPSLSAQQQDGGDEFICWIYNDWIHNSALLFWEEATHALLSLSCFRGGQSAGQCTHVKLDGSSSSYL